MINPPESPSFRECFPPSLVGVADLADRGFKYMLDGSLRTRIYDVTESVLFGAATAGLVVSAGNFVVGRWKTATVIGALSVTTAAGGVVTHLASQGVASAEIIKAQAETIQTQKESLEAGNLKQEDLIKTHQTVVGRYVEQNAAQQKIIDSQKENYEIQLLALRKEIGEITHIKNGLEAQLTGFSQEREKLETCITVLIKDAKGKQAQEFTAVESLIKERQAQLTLIEAQIVNATARMDVTNEQLKQRNSEYQDLIREHRTASEANNKQFRKYLHALAIVATVFAQSQGKKPQQIPLELDLD